MNQSSFATPVSWMPDTVQEAFSIFFRILTHDERCRLAVGVMLGDPALSQSEWGPIPSNGWGKIGSAPCRHTNLIGYGFLKGDTYTLDEVSSRIDYIRLLMDDESDTAFNRLVRWWNHTPLVDARRLVLEQIDHIRLAWKAKARRMTPIYN
jgi:hypothetical protein